LRSTRRLVETMDVLGQISGIRSHLVSRFAW
jgi:hypothetical protein